MNVRLHIERLVVDEGALAHGERDGLSQAIERELHARLSGRPLRPEGRGARPTPAHVTAIGDEVLARIAPPAAPATTSQGGPR